MEIIVIAKEKLVGKPIVWKEVYTEKTQYLKDQFDDIVGKGSYFRFEGKNVESGDEYYCIIGPAKIRTPIAKFFAGVRKLPATYSAGGKYFDSLDSAANYAHETWGIPILREMKPYTSAHLFGIAGKVERWKRKRERRKEREESKEGKEKTLEEKESSVSDFSCYRFSMAKPQAYREPYQWWNYDDIKKYFGQPIENIPPEIRKDMEKLNHVLKIDKGFGATLSEAENFHENVINKKAKEFYNLDPKESEKIQKTFIGYHSVYGHYIFSVGPYFGSKFKNSFGRFGYYRYKQSPATMDEIVETGWDTAVNKYKKAFGVDLDIGDFSIQFKALDPSSLLKMESTQSLSDIKNLAWKLPLPSSYALLMKYKGLLNKFKGQYGEGTKEFVINRLSQMYHAPKDYIVKELSQGTKIRSKEDLHITEVANQKRLEENATLNPEGYAFNQLQPMIRTGAEFKLNPSGYTKIISQYIKNIGFEPYMEKGIKNIFSGKDIKRKNLTQEFISEDHLRDLLKSNDPRAVDEVYRVARKIYDLELEQGTNLPINQIQSVKDAAEKNNKFKAFLNRPLDYGKFNIQTHYGAQQFTTLPGNDQQIKQLELRKEIIGALSLGARTIRDIQARLNQNIKRQNELVRHEKGIGQAEPEVPYNYVRDELRIIKEMAKEEEVQDYKILLSKMDEQIQGLPLRSNATEDTPLGFEDLKTAFLMASMCLTTDIPVDPRKRAKYLTVAKEKNLLFNSFVNKPDFKNYSQKDLMNAVRTGFITEPSKRKIEQSPTIIDIEQVENTYDPIVGTQEEQEIEEEMSENQPEILPVELPVEEIKLPEKKLLEPEIPTEEKVEENKGILAENPELESKENIVNKNLMSNAPVKDNKRLDKAFKDTLAHLVKIAKELDNENKGDAAEEIHKVIRKYQGRIL